MRRLSFLLLLCACGGEQAVPSGDGIPARITQSGNLDKDLDEVSGIAISGRRDDVLWVHEDSGARARIYAIGLDGRSLGRIRLENADNRDWEDAASFVLDGTPYLVIADIGDNDASHRSSKIYVIEEPDLDDDDRPELEAAWEIEFEYPNGARDAESIAVDLAGERILLLSKSDRPPLLFEIPLVPTGEDAVVVAAEIGPVDVPERQRPTAMDIAPNGEAIAVLTDDAVYYYRREAGESIYASLQRAPLAFPLDGIDDAESLAFSSDSRTIFMTVEGRRAPLLRIDTGGEQE